MKCFSLPDKCLLPHYGGCDTTRACVSGTFTANCGDCFDEYVEFEPEPLDACNRKL